MTNGCAGWAHDAGLFLYWSAMNIELGQMANGIAQELMIKTKTEECDLFLKWKYGAEKENKTQMFTLR